MQKVNLVGKVFGRLTVVDIAPSVRGRAWWVCHCECGNIKQISASRLANGSTISCGCYQKESARQRAINGKIGGYKGYSKYKSVADVLTNTSRNGDCLEWLGGLHSNGYAKIGKTALFSNTLLHREVYRLVHGEMPKVVMHKCDNRRCINPEHLVGGTQQENIIDMHKKGRARNQFSQQK